MPNLLVSATTRYDPKGLNKAKKHITGFEKTVKDMGKIFAGVFSTQKVLAFGKASVQAFVADDKAAKVLSRTLTNLGLAFADPSIKTFIADLEKQYGVLDDFLRPAYQKLITATGDLGKSQDLLKTALDLSAQSGESVVSVTSDLARAYAGNTKGLQKYSLGLTKAQLAAMSFEDILAKITEISKGQAAVAANTYAGKLDKLEVAAANASETIGGALVDAFATIAGDGNLDKAIAKIDLLSQGIATLISPTRMKSLFAGVDLKFGLIPVNKPATNYGAAQQSPGERNAAVAYNKKLALQKKEELAALMAKNKATREEAQMKKDQAALDALKAKFDLERIGLEAALNQATDEETKARIRAQIAILDETGKTAQAANDALVKAQAEKLANELKAATALSNLALATMSASSAIIKWISDLERMRETTGSAGGGFSGKGTPVIPGATPVIPGVTPVIPGATPVIPGATPVIPGVTPVIPGVTPVTPGVTPVIPGVTPVTPTEPYTPLIPLDPATAAAASADALAEWVAATTAAANAAADALETENAANAKAFQDSALAALAAKYAAEEAARAAAIAAASANAFLNTGGGADARFDQKLAANYSVVVNTGASFADENTIVDAVQAALNEIARRGNSITYAGAISA